MTSNLRRLLVPGALVLALGAGQAASAADSNAVLAIVNGKPVTEADVRTANADQFKAMELEYQKNQHTLLENGLDAVINEKLVEAEAAAKGMTKEALLAEIKPAAVSDADVDKFYEENKARIPRPKDQVAAQIKSYLEQQGQQKAQGDFYSGLKNKYKVEVKLEPIRVTVAANGPAKGPATAPVTIVEFSDFQCPFCSQLIPTLDQVKAKYGDKVRIVFRQYPLPFHNNAAKAAEAALCANEQGKFWELHDTMFKNQNALAVEDLKKSAATLGLNADDFGKCLDSGKHAAAVQNDMKEGAAAGVSGTPAMFINGRFISGAVPIDQITSVIDDELRRKGA
jgi:protein-disulfide isomerase